MSFLCSCFKKTYEAPEVVKIDYNHRSLMEVPPDVFLSERTLESLLLASNQIPDLPPSLFHCHELKVLDLSDNELSTIPSAIGSLTRLTTLDLSRNAITDVSDGIKNCKNMVTLDLSLNQLVKVPEGVSQLVNLEQLLLNDACLEFLHANVGRLTKLRILELRENQLQTLPKSLSRLTHLTRLDLSANDLPEIPEVVGLLTSLTELWVEGNSVRRIPKFIGNLTKLTCLDVANNDVREIAEEISKCSQLVDLTLCINSLDSLPDSFPKLENLSVLRLDSNQIEYLPQDFGHLKNLTEFSLLHNLLKALPPSIGLLKKLHTLYLDDNLLAALPKELGNCSSLTVLHAAKNRLTEIPSDFGRLSKLKVLALAGNLITHLPVSLLAISSLGAIWLSESQCKPMLQFITEIDPATGQNVLTCYLLPQMPAAPINTTTAGEDDEPVERVVRPSSRSIKFANDPESIVIDNNLKKGLLRAPTPYPKELRAMAKHASHFRQSRDQNGDVMSPDEPEYEGDYAEEDGVNLDERVLGIDGEIEHGLRRRAGGILDISALGGEHSSLSQRSDLANGDGDRGCEERHYRYRHPFHANYEEEVMKENKAKAEEADIHHLMNSESPLTRLYAQELAGVSKPFEVVNKATQDVVETIERREKLNKEAAEVETVINYRQQHPERLKFQERSEFQEQSEPLERPEPPTPPKTYDILRMLDEATLISDSGSSTDSPVKKVPPPYHVAARRAAFFRTPTQDPPHAISGSRGSVSHTESITGEVKSPRLPGLTTQYSSITPAPPTVITTAKDSAEPLKSTSASSPSVLNDILSRVAVSQASLPKVQAPPTIYHVARSEPHFPKQDTSSAHQSVALSVPQAGPDTTDISKIDQDSLDSGTILVSKAGNHVVKEIVNETVAKSSASTNLDVLNFVTSTTSAVSTKTGVLEEVRTPVIMPAVTETSKLSKREFATTTTLTPDSNKLSNLDDIYRPQIGSGMSSSDNSSRIPVLGSSQSKVSILDYEKSPPKYSTPSVPQSGVSKEVENGSSALADKFANTLQSSKIPSYSHASLKSVTSPTSASSSMAVSSSTSPSNTSSKIPSFSSKPAVPKPVNQSSGDASEKAPATESTTHQQSNNPTKSISTSKIPSFTSPVTNSFKRTGSGSRTAMKKSSLTDEENENSESSTQPPQSKIPTFGSGGRKPWIFGAHKNLRVVALDYKKINLLGFTICNGIPGDQTTDNTGVYVDSVESPEESAVRTGDKILQVDGIDISNMTLDIVRKVLSNCQESINIMVSRQT